MPLSDDRLLLLGAGAVRPVRLEQDGSERRRRIALAPLRHAPTARLASALVARAKSRATPRGANAARSPNHERLDAEASRADAVREALKRSIRG